MRLQGHKEEKLKKLILDAGVLIKICWSIDLFIGWLIGFKNDRVIYWFVD